MGGFGAAVKEWCRAALDDAEDWAREKYWLWRLPILAYCAYAGLRHMASAEYASWFGGITFGIHELGHVIFGWAPMFVAIAGGSFCQVAAPLAGGFVLLKQRDWFGVSVTTSWLAFSLWNLAGYIGDARARSLPLLGLSDDPIHDWHYMLGKLGMLPLDTTFAFLTRCAAFGLWIASCAFGGWLLMVMAQKR